MIVRTSYIAQSVTPPRLIFAAFQWLLGLASIEEHFRTLYHRKVQFWNEDRKLFLCDRYQTILSFLSVWCVSSKSVTCYDPHPWPSAPPPHTHH